MVGGSRRAGGARFPQALSHEWSRRQLLLPGQRHQVRRRAPPAHLLRYSLAAYQWPHRHAGHIATPVLQSTRLSGRGGMGHAGELETAMILALRPDLTHMERVVDETDFVSTESYYMDWIEGGALVANPPWDDDTATGAYGAGSLATAEHGRLWLFGLWGKRSG
ncbi:MAG: hypothetical protein DCC51_15225 [Anaerolineae bacterium]|nr:MAG: hypothetical protein DCC51_15225 [Anaerolineae bacterium]